MVIGTVQALMHDSCQAVRGRPPGASAIRQPERAEKVAASVYAEAAFRSPRMWRTSLGTAAWTAGVSAMPKVVMSAASTQ